MDQGEQPLSGWAIVLGASSGFGAACSLAFAKAGLNIVGVHLDRRGTIKLAEDVQAQIRATGREALILARSFRRNGTSHARCEP